MAFFQNLNYQKRGGEVRRVIPSQTGRWKAALFFSLGIFTAWIAVWGVAVLPRESKIGGFEHSMRSTFLPDGNVDNENILAAYRRYEDLHEQLKTSVYSWQKTASDLLPQIKTPEQLGVQLRDFLEQKRRYENEVKTMRDGLSEEQKLRLNLLISSDELPRKLEAFEKDVRKFRESIESIKNTENQSAPGVSLDFK